MVVQIGRRIIMKRLSKIETVSKPEVGKYYLVPCVNSELCHKKTFDYVNGNLLSPPFDYWKQRDSDKYNGVYVPVIGRQHEDEKWLGFKPQHFHYDWRFVKGHTLSKILDTWEREYLEKSAKTLAQLNENRFGAKVFIVDLVADTKIVYKRMKMVREMPKFPNSEGFKNDRGFEANYIGKKVKCGNICPHKGAPLAGGKIDAFGNVICPLHGLTFKNGVCVKRPSVDAEDAFLQREYENRC